MSRLVPRSVTLLIAALTLALAASCTSGDTFEIPESYLTSDVNYTLLYSTVGYDLAGPKRVLIRQNDPGAAISEGLAFSYRVIDDGDNVRLDGRATYQGTGWGIPIWTADFSELDRAGRYRVVVEAPEVQLATQEFTVEEFVLYRTTFAAVALENAAAREAPIELDNGYFGGNAKSGDATTHADWLVGLTEAFERRRNSMTEAQRQIMRDAIARSADYLLLLSDPATGEFNYKSPTRPYGERGPRNTALGTRALARYAASFQRDDPSRAERAHRRALLGSEWLSLNAPEAFPSWLRATVNYDLYRYSLVQRHLDAAADAVREQIGTYDLRTMQRPSADSVPHFEAMYRMWRDLTMHEDRQIWIDASKAVSEQYKRMFSVNPFGVLPPGTTEPEFETDAVAQWDTAALEPPPGEGDEGVVLNAWFMARGIDATFLADMTDDPALRTMASAGVGWVTGINPGIPVDRVRGTNGVSPVEAASFITGLPGRTAEPWSVWEWIRPRRHGSMVNGFLFDFDFDDAFASGETSLANDGLWLYASTAYEDFLQPARRAPSPDALPPYPRAIHVAGAEASEIGGALQLRVRVVDETEAPVPAVKVWVLWDRTPAEDEQPEDVFTTSSCTTGADGSCLAATAPDTLGGIRPITASVSNLEHNELPYDVTADDGSKIAVFE